MRLLVRGTGELVIERGAAFGRERGSCGGRFLATPRTLSTIQRGRQAEESGKLRVPMQHAMDHAASLTHDLAGNLEDFVHEGFELHSQPSRTGGCVRLAVTWRDRQEQRRPGSRAASDLRDQVLLVAAVIATEDDLGRGRFSIVGDVKEVADLTPESIASINPLSRATRNISGTPP